MKLPTVKENVFLLANMSNEAETDLLKQNLKSARNNGKTSNSVIKPTHEMTMEEFLEIHHREVIENSRRADIPPMPTEENPGKY